MTHMTHVKHVKEVAVERNYTIPVNEAFDDSREHPEYGCPICSLYRKLEEDELSLILGASMMEPDIRVKTNALGFCTGHYRAMLTRKNRLGLALMLESHLDTQRAELFPEGLAALRGRDRAYGRMRELEGSCYVCSRIEGHLSRMIETVVGLWVEDYLFRDKFAAQPHFCLPHYRRMTEYASKKLGRRERGEFLGVAERIELACYDRLREDVKAFCRSFDYRFEGETTPEQKNAASRIVNFLSANEGKESKPC